MTTTDTRSDKHKLLDQLMRAKTKRDLAHYVHAQRTAGRSWRLIAKDVTDLTGEDVSPPSLIGWFDEAGS